MTRQEVTDRILEEKLFAVLRLRSTKRIKEIVDAITKGGIGIIEVTLNSENAFDVIRSVSQECPDCLIGAGTVIGYDAAAQAIERGAKFLVSPVTDLDMLAVANQVGVVSIAGALTPTEAWQATQAGADFVKIFPLTGLGPQYIKALRGPLDDIRFIATNGVNENTIAEFFAAGVSAVGVGTPLISDADLDAKDFSAIETRTRKLSSIVRSLNAV